MMPPVHTIILALLLAATFNTSTSAVVSWQQPPGVAITCLRIYHVGAEYPAGICYNDLAPGPMRVDLPGILTHPAYRPAYGDRIVLAFGMDDVGEARLGESVIYHTYMPLMAIETASLGAKPLYLPLVL